MASQPFRASKALQHPTIRYIFVNNTGSLKANGEPACFSHTVKDGIAVLPVNSVNRYMPAGILMEAATTTQTGVRCQQYGLHPAVKVLGGTTSQDISTGNPLILVVGLSATMKPWLQSNDARFYGMVAVAMSGYAISTAAGTIPALIRGVV